jgi:hypothetical protein
MRRRHRFGPITVVLAGFVLAVPLAGQVAAGEDLTKKAFQRRANDLCGAGNRAIGEVFNSTFEGVDPDDELPPALIQLAADGALPILRDMLDRVGDLEGPPAFEKKVGRMLDQYRAVADDIEADPQRIVTEDDLFERPDKAARRLGLRRCVQEG